MHSLSRYIVKQIAAPAILATVVIGFLGAANALRGFVGELPADVVTPWDVTRVGLYALPSLFSIIVSVTFMFGTLLAFGRLAQDHELIAIKAAGVPLRRVVAPVLGVAFLLSVASFLIQDRVQPWARSKVYELVYTELPLRATLDVLPARVMHEYRDWRVYFGGRDEETGVLRDVMVIIPEGESGRSSVHYAQSARINRTPAGPEIELLDGYTDPPNNVLFTFDSFRIQLPQLAEMKIRDERESRTLGQLYAMEKQLEQRVEEGGALRDMAALVSERQEIAKRFALPFACFAIAFAAAPLGVRASRNVRSYTFSIGFGVMLLYYVIQDAVAIPLLLPLSASVALAWTPNAVMILLGAVFLWRVDRI